MTRYRYDKSGNMIGYTREQSQLPNLADPEFGKLVKIAVLGAPFAPILALAFFVFVYLHYGYGIHPVFSGIAAAIPVVIMFVLLWNSRAFRYLYFGLETLAVAGVVFWFLSDKADLIWASFGAIAVIVIGSVITHFVANYGFNEQPDP